MSKPRLAFAFGSGSARGWAHIGVLRALQQEGIVPDIVCGTSIGAFVGAVYASGELDALEAWVRGLTRRDVLGFFDVSLVNGGLIKGDKLLGFAARVFLDETFDQLERPFACVATDLASGREIWLKDGRVRASIALPGPLAPQLLDGRYLVIAVDLGMDTISLRPRTKAEAAPAPAPAWRQAMGRWLARDGDSEAAFRPSLADAVSNSIAIMQGRISRSRLAGEPADVLIAPRLGQLGLLDYHRADQAIVAGRKATEHMLPLLRSLIE